MSLSNPKLNATILQIVDNQLQAGTPPETRLTFERLCVEGYTAQEAKRLIGVVVLDEILETLQHRIPYDETHYIAALRRLPQLPGDQEAGK